MDARRGTLRSLARTGLRLAGWLSAALGAVLLARAVDARRLAPLEVWHTAPLGSEFRARDLTADYRFEDYLAQEARVFAELEREVYARVDDRAELAHSRYRDGGPRDPRGREPDWNRTYELAPLSPGPARGAALLVHGLSDGPYSLRSTAELLQESGFAVVGLRLPGHGTAPGALVRSRWEDWAAAVELGARRAKQLAGQGELWLVGYSAGGALVTRYAALAALPAARGLPRPDRLVLFSPALGVTSFARAGTWHRLLAWVPGLERFAWQAVEPEYDAYKYNSFPKRAGSEMHALAASARARMAALERAGGTDRLPVVLAFQSLVDATVLPERLLDGLFDHLPDNGSELVLFDVNELAALRPFLREPAREPFERAARDPDRRFRLTRVVNRSSAEAEVQLLTYAPRTATPETRELELRWPDGVYSLSHVAMPFPPSDPHYGSASSSLGALQPRGERGLLKASVEDLMRLRYDPFHALVEEALRSVLP